MGEPATIETVPAALARGVDESGRIIPISEPEQPREAARLRQAIADIATITDDSDDTVDWEEAERELGKTRGQEPISGLS